MLRRAVPEDSGILFFSFVFFFLEGSEQYNLEVQNLVDIKTENNFEIAMKMSTSIKNKDIFYTDLNGLQVRSKSNEKYKSSRRV